MNTTNKEKPDKHQEPWLQHALSDLDQSVETMDPAIETRLNAARRLANREQNRAFRFWEIPQWLTGAAIACSIALVATVAINMNTATNQPVESHIATTNKPITLDVMPIMTARDDLEFYESIDFLLWLEKEKDGIS